MRPPWSKPLDTSLMISDLPFANTGFFSTSLLSLLKSLDSHVIVRFTIAVMEHYDQSNLGKTEFIWLTLSGHS